MSIYVLISAVCIVVGVLLLCWEALAGRPLSSPRNPAADAAPTLEPKGQGLGFLGVKRNWTGLGLIAAGMVIFVATF
ncbi:hypothetical protein [Sinorhizobium sp. NFACC03]|uniref:hypothetical protein n=1 Tax=Sinorhizobium sp. NFACC03 TaxID=1566295 RepID=UPI000B832F13|nr:hypothetical protein [Sinorhizobium sp. NFACC03]